MLAGMRWLPAWLALLPIPLLLSACARPGRDVAPPERMESARSRAGVLEATVDPELAPGALRTADGAPIVVVVETRDRSIAVTAELVRDPSRTDLRELRAPRVMADVEPTLLLQPAASP